MANDGIAVQTRDGLKAASYRSILKVQRRDSVRNGVLLGGAIGAAVASLPLAIGNECRYETCDSQFGFPLAGVAIGAAIGWGLDSAIKGWKTVFDSGAVPRLSAGAGQGGFVLRAAFTW